VASIQRYYELYIDLLMDGSPAPVGNGTDAQAFKVSERSLARSLLDNLAEAEVDIRQGIDPDLLGRERALKRRIDDRSERWDRAAADSRLAAEAAVLAEEVQGLSAEYDQLQAEIRSRSPRYAALTQPRPLSLDDVQQQILDEDTLLLEYSLGEERSFLWAVEKNRHASYELAGGDRIEKLSNDLYDMLTARTPRAEETVREYRQRVAKADTGYWEVAAKASDMLLGQVADRLDDKRIVIVSDGALQYLPFGSLPVPGRSGEPVPMIAEHEIVNLPSASVLSLLRNESRGKREHTGSVAVLADPVFEVYDPRLKVESAGADSAASKASAVEFDLSGGTERGAAMAHSVRGTRRFFPRLESTRREADAIIDLAPEGTVFHALDFEASRETVISADLGQYKILHFATHGVVDNQHPRRSGIVLSLFDERGQSQDGFLRLNDIYNLDLGSELVVLSACDTALGKPVDGEGLIGLVRGFMYAGVPRIVASLWKVDDEATSELMIRFYRQMLRENRRPAAALREAQVSMWREEEWRQPYFWAAFVLQGDWR
jgi:CHAT domain-containing protein